jgi:hypothetical protein
MPIVDAKGCQKKTPGRTEPTTTATAMKIDDRYVMHKNQNPRAAVVMLWWLTVQSFTTAAAATAPPPQGATTSTAIRSLQGAAPSPPRCNLIEDLISKRLNCTLDQYCDSAYETIAGSLNRYYPNFVGDVTCEKGNELTYYVMAQNKKVNAVTAHWIAGILFRVDSQKLRLPLPWPSEPDFEFAEGLSFKLEQKPNGCGAGWDRPCACVMELAGKPCDTCKLCHDENGQQTTADNVTWYEVDCTNVFPGLKPTTCTNTTGGWVDFLKQVDEKKQLFNTTQQPPSPSLCNTAVGGPPSTTFSRKEVMIAAFGSVGITILAVVIVGAVAGFRVVRAAPRRLHPAPPRALGELVTPPIQEPESALPAPPAAPMAEVPATGPMESVSTLSSRMMTTRTPRRRRTDPPVVVARTPPPPPLPIIAEAVLMVDPIRSAAALEGGDNHHDNHDNNQDHRNSENNYVPATNGPLFKDQAQSSRYSL